MDYTTHNRLVEKIIQSNSFGTSNLYVNLLKYLVECSQKGEVPKEIEVSIHLFGGRDVAEHNSGKVRVHIYNLRKKLKVYYENEGKEDALILSIPKGGYRVEFSEKSEKEVVQKPKISKTKKQGYRVLAPLLAISVLFNLFLFFRLPKASPTESKNPSLAFWSDFMEDEKPTLVVLGDLFIFHEKDPLTGLQKNVRMPHINSVNQFESLLKKSYDSASIETEYLTYTYLIKSSATWIEQLTKVFYPQQQIFSTRVMSRVDIKDLHDYNIVFVGMQKTAGILNNYFLESEFDFFNTSPEEYQFQQGDSLKHYFPTGDPDFQHKDYGFIAKFPGPNNNTFFMFGGLWDTATSEALKNFTDPNHAAKLKANMVERFGEIPPYFEILIEVSGVDRVGLDTKVLYMKEVFASPRTWTVDPISLDQP